MRIGKMSEWVRLLSCMFGRSRVCATPITVTGMLAMYKVLPTALPSGKNCFAIASVRMAGAFSLPRSSTFSSTSLLWYSSALKSRPAISFRPRVLTAFSPTMYCAPLIDCASGSGEMANEVFQEPPWNGSWLTMVTLSTPGMPRSEARSSAVRASASTCSPIPLRPISIRWLSSMPLASCMASMRCDTMNSALQMMAQLSAISSTISAAAVLCRDSVERMGRISMRYLQGSEK